jgi:hypothetical protein
MAGAVATAFVALTLGVIAQKTVEAKLAGRMDMGRQKMPELIPT